MLPLPPYVDAASGSLPLPMVRPCSGDHAHCGGRLSASARQGSPCAACAPAPPCLPSLTVVGDCDRVRDLPALQGHGRRGGARQGRARQGLPRHARGHPLPRAQGGALPGAFSWLCKGGLAQGEGRWGGLGGACVSLRLPSMEHTCNLQPALAQSLPSSTHARALLHCLAPAAAWLERPPMP